MSKKNVIEIYAQPPGGFRPTAQIAIINTVDNNSPVMCQIWHRDGMMSCWVVLPTMTVDEINVLDVKESPVIVPAKFVPKLHSID